VVTRTKARKTLGKGRREWSIGMKAWSEPASREEPTMSNQGPWVWIEEPKKPTKVKGRKVCKIRVNKHKEDQSQW